MGPNRRVWVIAHDFVVLVMAWVGARLLSTAVVGDAVISWQQLAVEINLILIIQGFLQWRAGLYRGVWRFASLPDLGNLLRASILGAVAGITVMLLLDVSLEVMLLVVWAFPAILLLFLSLPRLAYRMLKDMRSEVHQRRVTQRTLILGAGRSGQLLLPELKRRGHYDVVGYLDDNEALQGKLVSDLPVLGPITRLPRVCREAAIDLVVIAIPSATNQQMQRIVSHCEAADVEFKTLPTLKQMGATLTRFDDLKSVAIEDLLGRDPISLDWDGLRAGLAGRRVLVTGGGGSIGAELCRQIARLDPASLVIFDNCEYNLYRVDYRLRSEFSDLIVETRLGSVCDEVAVRRVMEDHQPDVVFHAAAFKHLPMLQNQAREAFRNNVLGTKRLADAAIDYDVDTFVLISTDKAVNPSNVMGATKRIAELYCQYVNQNSDTRFITVRFGNVLNSTGSVVPLFNEQIRNGGPVTVTHPDITRYFMTISEAGQLILQAAVLGQGGEVFVLDMGEPVRISYLAEQLIRLAGKEPGHDIEIVYTGLRPGEKLFEELFHEHEPHANTGHEKIFLSRTHLAHHELNQLIADLKAAERASHSYETQELMALLFKMVPELGRRHKKDGSKVIRLAG